MKAPIQTKIRNILSLYSPNSSNPNESISTIQSDSFSSYYARTIPNDDSNMDRNSLSARRGFIRQKELNDFVNKVYDSKKKAEHNIINAKFNRLSHTGSNRNKKFKKRISTITDNYILGDIPRIRDSIKSCSNTIDKGEENDKKGKMNGLSVQTTPKKEERKERIGNYGNVFKDRKPLKRFYISDLCDIEGNFGKKKIEWKIKKAVIKETSKEEQKKIDENSDIDSYGMFVHKKKDHTVKNMKYALKPF